MILSAIVLAAAAASAGELIEIPRLEIGVHPILVPALSEPGSPTLGLLEDRAGTLVDRVEAGTAEQYMSELASPKASAADRLAAGALARLVAEPGLAYGLASLSPRL